MEYFAALSLSQAEKIKKTKAGSAYLAGGTMLNWRGAPRAKALIDLKNLNMSGIKASAGKVTIGSYTTIQEISRSSKVPEALAKTAARFTSLNVRNMATIGGAIAGGFFISHLLPVLAACEAEVEYYLAGRKKKMPMTDWMKSRKGIICSVIIKKLKRKVLVADEKIVESDFPAIVTSLGCDMKSGKIANAVVAVSGAYGNLSVSENAAKYLNGLKAGDADGTELSRALQKDIKVLGNVKVSARVKQRMIESHLRALLRAI